MPASRKPENVGDTLDRFSQSHIVGENSAEAVGGEIGEELEALGLVRTEIGLQRRGHLGVGIDLNILGAILDALPGLGVENFGSLGVGQLHGVHAVGLAGEVEGVESETSDRIALVVVELDFQTHPGAIVHAHITTPRSHKLTDLALERLTPSTSITTRKSNQSIS